MTADKERIEKIEGEVKGEIQAVVDKALQRIAEQTRSDRP
jgi:hypothetical protein